MLLLRTSAYARGPAQNSIAPMRHSPPCQFPSDRTRLGCRFPGCAPRPDYTGVIAGTYATGTTGARPDRANFVVRSDRGTSDAASKLRPTLNLHTTIYKIPKPFIRALLNWGRSDRLSFGWPGTEQLARCNARHALGLDPVVLDHVSQLLVAGLPTALMAIVDLVAVAL